MSEYVIEGPELQQASKYLLPSVTDLIWDVPPHSVVVDLGCGNGSVLAQFRQRGWALHGFDISPSAIEIASKTYSGIQFTCCDLTTDLSSHPLAGRCDAIISTEVIEHIFLPRLYVKNCNSFLKPGGILIISTPYHGYIKNLALALFGKMDFHHTALLDYGHIKFWSRRTLTTLLEEGGFEVERFVGAGRAPFLWCSMVILAKKR
jgi:2-polyprenyl-6-hydroxyphenyl methylase/3-demethylubiquinone-9 3-methyltransferase